MRGQDLVAHALQIEYPETAPPRACRRRAAFNVSSLNGIADACRLNGLLQKVSCHVLGD
jgi:hypothetical protein